CWVSVLTVVCVSTFIFFFFSSRRRHTRSKRDWSSDVCSSDLHSAHVEIVGCIMHLIPYTGFPRALTALSAAQKVFAEQGVSVTRSEERRVGKECRYRGGRDQ